MHGMQREDESSEPRVRNREALQYAREKNRDDSMQHEVEDVVAQWVVAPHPMLEPKRAVQERIVLLGGAEIRPNPPETGERTECGACNMRVIVPDKTRAQRWEIGEKHRAENRDREPR